MKRSFKCPYCGYKTDTLNRLIRHVKIKHDDKIPDDISVKQHLFNIRNKKTRGSCVICKSETDWNEEKGRYEKYCSEKCKKEASRRAKENMRKVYGKDHLLNDPNYQRKLQEGRSNAGFYKFEDGGEVFFLSSYEKDFLEFLDEDLKILSKDVVACNDLGIMFTYEFDGDEKIYMPDYYMPDYNLIIEIKEGTNTHPKIQKVDRKKEELKDLAVIKSKKYNYIKIVDKEYSSFINLIRILKDKPYENNSSRDRIIILNDHD